MTYQGEVLVGWTRGATFFLMPTSTCIKSYFFLAQCIPVLGSIHLCANVWCCGMALAVKSVCSSCASLFLCKSEPQFSSEILSEPFSTFLIKNVYLPCSHSKCSIFFVFSILLLKGTWKKICNFYNKARNCTHHCLIIIEYQVLILSCPATN